MPKTKACSRCKAVKPLADFNISRSQPDGKQPWCRNCQRDYSQERLERLEHVECHVANKETVARPDGRSLKKPADPLRRPAWERRIIRAFLSDLIIAAETCSEPDVMRFLETWQDVRGSKKDWRYEGIRALTIEARRMEASK